MISTHDGHHDRSLEPSVHLHTPDGFKWPPALKKLIAAHDAAWDAWSAAELAQIDATAAFDRSGEEDKALLIEAVAAGQPDPGTPRQEETRRACVYAEEVARQAAAKVDALVLQIREAMPAHGDDLLTQACNLEREAIAESVKLMNEAQEIATQANALRRSVGSRANWLTDMLDLGTSAHRIASNAEEVQWLMPWQLENTAALHNLDLLEGVSQSQAVADLVNAE